MTIIPSDAQHTARTCICIGGPSVQPPGQRRPIAWPAGCDAPPVMETAAMLDLKGYDRNAHRIAVLAHGNRERKRTASRNTVASVTRWWVIVIGLVLAACGGGDRPKNAYARASHAQERCCEHLQGPPRDQCLQALVRVEDPAVAATDTNQDTYACVVRHFACDPATGHATQASAQAQLDCIQDLDQ
jgi:hypothetical protein